MTPLGAAQKNVFATPVQNAASKKVAAAAWKITPCLHFSGREKGKKSGFKPTPVLSGAEGNGEVAVLGLHITDLPALCQNVAGFEKKKLLNLHSIYRTVSTDLGLVFV